MGSCWVRVFGLNLSLSRFCTWGCGFQLQLNMPFIDWALAESRGFIMSMGNWPYSSTVEHDARFQSSKGVVLIAVVTYVCSDFSFCQMDLSQSWQVELDSLPGQQVLWPKWFQLSGLQYLSSWACLNSFFLAYMSQDKWEYRTNSLSADWVCHVDIKMWFRSLFNMIHAVPCVKYLVSIAVTCVRDDFKVSWFIAITISYEMFEGSVCFFPGSFGANEASWRTRAASVTWYVLKGVIFWSNLRDFI